MGPIGKLFHMFQTITLQTLINFGYREGYRFKFENWEELKIDGKV
jgi:hypothetical protein